LRRRDFTKLNPKDVNQTTTPQFIRTNTSVSWQNLRTIPGIPHPFLKRTLDSKERVKPGTPVPFHSS